MRAARRMAWALQQCARRAASEKAWDSPESEWYRARSDSPSPTCLSLASPTLATSGTIRHPLGNSYPFLSLSVHDVIPIPFTFLLFFSPSSSVSSLPYASAATPSVHGLSLFSINANKTNAIKQYVSASLPHVWVVNETKSFTPIASHVFVSGYNIFESTALRGSGPSRTGEGVRGSRRGGRV